MSSRGHTAHDIQQAGTGIYVDDRSFGDSDVHRKASTEWLRGLKGAARFIFVKT